MSKIKIAKFLVIQSYLYEKTKLAVEELDQ